MSAPATSRPPKAAFVIIGLALMVLGFTANFACFAAGALFVFVGLAATMTTAPAPCSPHERSHAPPLSRP